MTERNRRGEGKSDRLNGLVPLSELEPGQKGVLRAVQANRTLAHRLMALGVLPGEEIQVVRTAAFGDPIEVSVRGFRLALRRNDARSLLVEITTEKERKGR